jgi:inorganic triphosphatase YgiF
LQENGFSFMEINTVIGTEIEIKLNLLNEHNFNRLTEYFGKNIVQTKQENFFYDTADKALSKTDWVLRIRRTQSDIIATLKGKAIENNDGLTVRPEFNESVSLDILKKRYDTSIDLADLPANIINLVKNLPVSDKLERTISFVNYRSRAILQHKDIELTFEIDKTIYADGSTEYELEIELLDRKLFETVVEIIRNLFEKLEIPFQTEEKSKYAKALLKVADPGL